MRSTAIVAATLVALAVGPVFSAQAADETKRPARASDAKVQRLRPHPGGLIQAEWLESRPVLNADNKEMGKIEEVWFDPKDGRVKEVVVGAGGFLGMGERRLLVDWKDVRVAWEEQNLVVRMDEPILRNARPYERDRQPAASPR
jgi:sporulation protein YlmC with PRC-barrel domain